MKGKWKKKESKLVHVPFIGGRNNSHNTGKQTDRASQIPCANNF